MLGIGGMAIRRDKKHAENPYESPTSISEPTRASPGGSTNRVASRLGAFSISLLSLPLGALLLWILYRISVFIVKWVYNVDDMTQTRFVASPQISNIPPCPLPIFAGPTANNA